MFFGKTSGLEMPPSKNSILLCITLYVTKSDTIIVVMATSPPAVSLKRDLIGPRLTAWNALLQHLASVQLSPRSDEF
jgi:hypothetical protein